MYLIFKSLPILLFICSCNQPDIIAQEKEPIKKDKKNAVDCDVSLIKTNPSKKAYLPYKISMNDDLKFIKGDLDILYRKSVQLGKLISDEALKQSREGIAYHLNNLKKDVLLRESRLIDLQTCEVFIPLAQYVYCYYQFDIEMLDGMLEAINDKSIPFMKSYERMYVIMNKNIQPGNIKTTIINKEIDELYIRYKLDEQ